MLSLAFEPWLLCVQGLALGGDYSGFQFNQLRMKVRNQAAFRNMMDAMWRLATCEFDTSRGLPALWGLVRTD